MGKLRLRRKKTMGKMGKVFIGRLNALAQPSTDNVEKTQKKLDEVLLTKKMH